ncbi:MAG: hypothetical protein NTY48_03765 [Candidatus Diapherotrites archaeon]|nr:hypothetical protein [Candidatus Diapherotrites archaeon]
MQTTITRIENEKLPQKVRNAIKDILAHRKQINAFTKAYGIASISTLTVLSAPTISKNLIHRQPADMQELSVLGKSSVGFGAMLAATGLAALRAHKEEYANKELALYRALKEARKIPQVKQLLESHPYIVVDRKGNLVGKKVNPKIWFVPIGRRRIPTFQRPKILKRKKAAVRNKL